MTDADTISCARFLEAERWARQGYRLTRFDGPIPMTADERAEYVRTGRPPDTIWPPEIR